MARIDTSAPNFQRTIASNFDQATFITWIKDNFTACGFPAPVESAGNNPKYLAYDLNFDPTKTYGRVWFIVQIPDFAVGTSFTVYTGLCDYTRYNTTTFRYTTDLINAGGCVLASNANMGTNTDFSFSSASGYTAYNFPIGQELIGSFILTAGSITLTAFLGMSLPANIFNEIDKNLYNYVALAHREFITNLFGINNSDFSISNSAFSIPFPNAVNNVGVSGQACINHYYERVGESAAPSLFANSGNCQLVNVPALLYQTSTTASPLSYKFFYLGQYSDDIVMGFSDVPVGNTIIITSGVEEYFVVNSNLTSSKMILAVRKV